VTAIFERSFTEALQRIVSCFRRERISYILIGAWALAAWGRPRATADVDFLVLADEGSLSRLGDRMARAGITPDETWSQWNPLLKGSQLRLQFKDMIVDLLRPRDPHDRQAFRRKRRKRMDGRYYWVVSPEDFILQKLKRPRDFEDALSVPERSGEAPDKRYLARWAYRIRVSAETPADGPT
jgi:hypothetical protein